MIEANGAGERFWQSLGFGEVRRVGPDSFKARLHRRIELARRIGSGFAPEESVLGRSAALHRQGGSPLDAETS